ncbi:MAG TPA: alpha/beta hydrolase, partial [Bryobacteraceae bacterium]|nr:alpha/beta hydrolase [Bryobacteraceae bacterium]
RMRGSGGALLRQVRGCLLIFHLAAGALPGQLAVLPPSSPGPPPKEMAPDPEKHPVVMLWPNGAPGSEAKKQEQERYRTIGDLLIIANEHHPSITLYLPPKQIATGAAFVVAPGGGFQELWITDEGYRIGEWLSRRGIAAFVLKYRLPKAPGETAYTVEGDSVADMQRAIRTVRSRATEWNVDPDRVGAIGFSAGGTLAGLAGTRWDVPVKNPVDAIDRLSARPSFMALIYGTPFTTPMQYPVRITKETPPTFLAGGGDDRITASYPEAYKMLREAGVSVELHIYAGVPHGFGIQDTNASAVASWTDRLRDWMFDRGFLQKH